MTNSAGGRLSRFFSNLVVYLVTLLMIVPLIWTLLMSFKTNSEIFESPLSLPSSFSFENYTRALETLNIPKMYLNTIFVAVMAVGIALIVSFMSSYALSRMVFKNRLLQKSLNQYLLMGLMISPFILLFPVYRLAVWFKLYNTFWALILPYIATQLSFNTLLLVNFFKGIPGEIEEACLIDGCTLFQLCTRIIAPMAKPVLFTVLVFNVLYIWNEYPIASVLLQRAEMYTLSMGASMFKGAYSVDNAGIVAASMLIIVPQLVFFGFFQRYIVDGMTAGAVKG
ncbi:carbohydrate ABC transporter permease [Allofournierella sp.]|uniref:carbohydrate ABC transporter permease n=1 Tax=Allofournierella sp. TaxID=1940256 RepID=UPI003AB1C20C